MKNEARVSQEILDARAQVWREWKLKQGKTGRWEIEFKSIVLDIALHGLPVETRSTKSDSVWVVLLSNVMFWGDSHFQKFTDVLHVCNLVNVQMLDNC